MDKTKNDKRPVWMLVTSMLIFGTIGLIRRYIPLPSALIAFIRGVIGGLFILPFALRRKGDRMSRRDMILLITAGILIGFNWVLLFEAYNYTTVAVATLCYYMQPTIVMLLSPLIFRERLTGRKAACAAAAVAGMVLVSGVLGDGGGGSGDPAGVLLGLGAAVFYSSVVIMNNMIRGINACRKTVIQLLSAGLVMVPYLLLTDGFSAGSFTPAAVILILVVGIVHTGIAYVLYFGSMDGLRVQTVAILSYIDPVSALLFSAVLLREPLSPLNLIGAVMIIGSAVISELQKPETL